MVKSYLIRWTEPASHVQHAAAAAPPRCHCLPKSPSNCFLQGERGHQDPWQGFPQRGECKGQEWQEATQSRCVAGWQVPFLNLEGQHIVSRSPKSCKQSEFTKLKLNPVKKKPVFAPCHFIGLAPAQKYRSNAAAQYTAGQCEIVRWEWRLLPRPDMIWNYILMQKLSQVSAKNEKSRTIIKPMESLKILALDKSTHGHPCKSENQLSHLSTILATCRLAIN